MYVVTDYTFTPDVGNGYDELVIPGVYKIERFVSIENATRNDVLYSATGDHLGSIVVTDDGFQTTVLIYTAATDNSSEASDKIRILVYDPTPTGSGPSSNVTVTNWPASQNVNGVVSISGEVEVKNDTGNPLPVTGSIAVSNFPAIQPVSGTVSVGNFPAVQSVTGSVGVTNFPATQTVDGTVNVGNFPATQPISGSVSVNNFPATQTVDGTVTANQGTDPWNIAGAVTSNQGTSPWISSITNFPATQAVSGTVTANQGTSPWVVSGTTTSTVSSFPTTSTDAFGRLRVSEPYTLFDSSTRYTANGKWSTQTVGGASATFNANQGLMDLTVPAAFNSLVRRETTKVFSYQPGKSLLLYTTFVMSGEAGIRQSVGYYNDDNGYSLLKETDGQVYMVEKSRVSGSVTENSVPQTSWNVDPFNGTGPSGISLDFTKAQILWIDMEWLGVGTVRTGFVVDGKLLPAHYFQHANIVESTYITTASLPFRYEIENISSAVGGTLKQICSTAISEGGYTLSGEQHSVSTPITSAYALATAGTYYPVAALRLKSTRLDAISIVTGLTLLGEGNNETYAWRLISRGTVTGGTWSTPSASTPVEYNLTGVSSSGGTVLASGFTNASNQGSPIIDILKGSLFTNQLERDPFTATPFEVVLEVAPASNAQGIFASVSWEDVVL